jgi:tRNA(fMet)-specific endonuclease VapC
VKYLLDTCTISDAMNNPGGAVASRMVKMEGEDICTSIIVAAELHFGVLNKGSERKAKVLERILEKLEVLPLLQPVERHYAEVRLALERKGRSIGQNDTMIAAHALMLKAIVVTDNVKHFSQVPGLRIENWLR